MATKKWQELGYKNVGSYNRAVDLNTGIAPNLNTQNQVNNTTQSPDIKQLESTIKSGNFSASDARAYNKATGNQQGARELALGSQQAVDTMQTSVTADEFKGMQDAGIKDSANIGKGITADLQGGTQEEFKQDVQTPTPAPIQEKTITQTPEGTTTVTKELPKTNAITKDTAWEDTKQTTADLEQIIEARYGTIATQNADGTITATIGDKKYQWSIGVDGKPVKTEVQQTEAEKARISNFNKFASLSDDLLSQSLKTGALVMGTQAYNDLMNDPVQKVRLKKIQKLNMIGGKMPNQEDVEVKATDEILNNNKVTINGATMSVAQALDDGFISQQEYDDLTSTPEIKARNERVRKLALEKADLEAKWKAIEDETDKELEGTGATTTRRAQIISNKRKDIGRDLDLVNSNYQIELGYRNDLKNNATALFTTNLGLYQKADERTYAEQQLAESRAYEEQARTKKLEQAYQYQYGDLNSTNPTLQNIAVERAVADMYTKYPIPGMESQAIKVQKVKDRMAQGMTGTEAIASVENEIRSSQRYQDYLASEKAKITPKATESWQKLTDGSLYNQVTGEVKSVGATGTGGATGDLRGLASQFPGQAWAKNNNPAGITWNANFDNPKPGTTAYALQQAGVNFSKGTARPSAEGGNYVTFDTIEDGLLAQQIMMTQTYGNSTVNQMLQKWVGTKEGPNYAKQVAGNAGVDLNTKVSDLSQEQLASLQMAKIQKESPGLYKLLSSEGEAEGPIDAGSGAPITYARRIKNMIPSTLQNSELEAKNINDTIKALYKKGVSAEDAALAYMGVELKPEVKQIGISMIDTLKGTDATPGSYTAIADALNKGNQAGAVQLLENTLYKQRGIPTTDINEIGNNVKNGQNLIDRINTLKNKFGPISGRESEWALVVQNDPTTQRVLADMTNFIAKYRNGIAGTSVTGNEEDFLKNIIPSITNKPDNAIAKIQSNIGQSFNGLNTIRDTIGLPILQDQRSAYDINLRKQAFTGRGTGAKTSAPSNVKTEIIKTSNGKTYNINF